MEHLEFIQPPPDDRAAEDHPWIAFPLRARVAAAGVDSVIALICGAAVTIVVALIWGAPGSPEADGTLWPMALGMPAGALIYLGLTEGRRGPRNGQTFGKGAIGLRTVSNDGTPLHRAAAWQRAALLAFPMAFVGFPGHALAEQGGLEGAAAAIVGELPTLAGCLAVALTLTNAHRRSLHDWATRTTVVGAERLIEAGDDPILEGSPIIAYPRGRDSFLLATLAFAVVGVGTFGPSPF